jgi:hypothetical protein
MKRTEKNKIMQPTNLVTAANVNNMKCHISRMCGMVGLPVSVETVGEIMGMFSYESESIETCVFAWIKETRGVYFPGCTPLPAH